MPDEPDPYLEVARRFFNEFLELKVSLDRDGAVPQRTQEKERAKYEKELKKWADANNALKGVAQELAHNNEALERDVEKLELEVANLRLQLNEHLMRQNDVARKLNAYPLDQHMSEEAYKQWIEIRNLMAQTPSRRSE